MQQKLIKRIRNWYDNDRIWKETLIRLFIHRDNYLKIKFKLEDYRFCEGCPAIGPAICGTTRCNLGYNSGKHDYVWRNKITGKITNKKNDFEIENWEIKIKRPKACIYENGR